MHFGSVMSPRLVVVWDATLLANYAMHESSASQTSRRRIVRGPARVIGWREMPRPYGSSLLRGTCRWSCHATDEVLCAVRAGTDGVVNVCFTTQPVLVSCRSISVIPHPRTLAWLELAAHVSRL